MEFIDIVKKRYAVKKFDSRKVPEKKVDALFEMIKLAPSSLNLQPWKIKVITDQNTKEKLSPATKYQAQVTTCSHLLIFCADTDLKGLIEETERTLRAAGTPAPQITAKLERLNEFRNNMTAENILPWTQRQVYLALGNALNGATSLGLGSCPMESFNPTEYSKILKLPQHIVPTVLCPIGYPADEPKPKTRYTKGRIFF
ncbi:MAG: NAD(P)H-dependent oxidoreductase [Candidatus Micrarchaeota archaeon]